MVWWAAAYWCGIDQQTSSLSSPSIWLYTATSPEPRCALPLRKNRLRKKRNGGQQLYLVKYQKGESNPARILLISGRWSSGDQCNQSLISLQSYNAQREIKKTSANKEPPTGSIWENNFFKTVKWKKKGWRRERVFQSGFQKKTTFVLSGNQQNEQLEKNKQ